MDWLLQPELIQGGHRHSFRFIFAEKPMSRREIRLLLNVVVNIHSLIRNDPCKFYKIGQSIQEPFLHNLWVKLMGFNTAEEFIGFGRCIQLKAGYRNAVGVIRCCVSVR